MQPMFDAGVEINSQKDRIQRMAAEIDRLRAALKGIEIYATSKEDAKGMAAKALLADEQSDTKTEAT